MRVTSYQLKNFPDETVFTPVKDDSLKPEEGLYKKKETLEDGDILVEEMYLAQFGEIPGEVFRLGISDDDEQEWEIWEPKDVQIMIGWLMTSQQMMDLE